MSGPTFAEFTAEVRGRTPFPWQAAFADSLRADQWPETIVAPTGLGKTAVLDAFVWALASSIGAQGREGRVPVRAFFVVDRRIVVNAAFESATELQRLLREPPPGSSTEWVADRLRQLPILGDSSPLEVVRMRGGVSWSWRWVREPAQPTIVCATVDQFGSRLLFRGYGTGAQLRPIDAGLCGQDSVLFLDEAHLSQAMLETISTASSIESHAAPGWHRPLRVVAMTATPPPRRTTGQMALTDADRQHPVAARRLEATKTARLVEISDAGRSRATATAAMVEVLAELAVAATKLEGNGVVAVVVNTIDLARSVREHVAEHLTHGDCELVIGRCRSIDREVSRLHWWDRAKAGRERSAATSPLVLVATQTVEVGADLDVDVLITEVAPLDALVQRFGRVDRLGAVGSTVSWIVHAAARSSTDPVYGPATDRTWSWLIDGAGGATPAKSNQAGSLVGGDGPQIDLGIAALQERLEATDPDDRAELAADPPPAPDLLWPMLFDWARTAPAPEPDRPVGPFLHGLNVDQPTVTLLWRAVSSAEALERSLSIVAPAEAEQVDVPLVALRRFVARQPTVDLSDLDTVIDAIEEPGAGSEDVGWIVRGLGDGELIPVRTGREIRPGDVVVLRASRGGHDEFGWAPEKDGLTADIADFCDRPRSGRVLRLGAEAWTTFAPALLHAVHQARSAITAEDADDVTEVVESFLGTCVREATGRYGSLVRDFAQALAGRSWMVGGNVFIDDDADPSRYGDPPLVYLAIGRLATEPDDATALGSSAGSLTGPPKLRAHLSDVGERARQFAESAGLPPDLVAVLEAAGQAHDLGKADRRFQAALRGGDVLAAEVFDGSDDILAKSAPSTRAARAAAAKVAQLPSGFRHEAVSVALVRQHAWPVADADLHEHLVAAHHGHARPLFPGVVDSDPVSVVVHTPLGEATCASDDVIVDWSQPARFRRLCQRYGVWGLAYLEMVLRLADISISEEGR